MNDMQDKSLREHLCELLKGGNAHAKFEDVVPDTPVQVQGKKPQGLPHSPWMLLEHLRITQWDILEFSRNPKHESPEWPSGYWPKTENPPNAKTWHESVVQFGKDLKSMQDMITNSKTDLFAKIPGGEGQTVLREALLLSDHNAYHLAQLVDVRRALGAWPEK